MRDVITFSQTLLAAEDIFNNCRIPVAYCPAVKYRNALSLLFIFVGGVRTAVSAET